MIAFGAIGNVFCAHSFEVYFKLVFVNETGTEYLKVEEGTPIHLLECILYGADQTPLARCKHYMRPEYYKISYTVRL